MEKNVKSRQHWHELVGAQQTSGLTVKDFCARKKIYTTTFYSWRKRLGVGKNKMGGFTRLKPTLAAQWSGIRIETPNGYHVDVGYGGEGGLKSVLEMLGAL